MTPQNIADKARKVIEVSKDDAVVKDVYFNPLFASRLKNKVPELKKANLFITVTETEAEDGTIKEASIKSKNSGDVMSLGSLLLDGMSVKISQPLATVDALIDFIAQEAMDIPDKTVDQKEDIREAKLEEETGQAPKRRVSIF